MFSVSILFSLLLTGCNSETSPPAKDKTAVEKTAKKEQPKKAKAKFGKFNAADLEKAADEINVVPSPIKMQEKLSKAGINGKLSELVTAGRGLKMDSSNKDEIAIRIGVILADLVLTVQNSPKDQMNQRLNSLKAGFKKIGAGTDIQSTIDEMISTVGEEKLDRKALLGEMDELAQVMVPELEYEAGEWVVPLIQAGTWLEGAHLVAAVVKKEGKIEEGAKILKQPGAIKYFLRYVQREGNTRAPKSISASLETTLKELHTLSKKSTMTQADVEKVHSTTGMLLNLL